MTPLESFLAFTVAAALLTITPGLDTALILRTAAAEGARRAFAAGFGICLGCLAWGAAVAVGLGALIEASRLAYALLKYAGAAYLLWLGMRLILSPRREFAAGLAAEPAASAATWFRRGLLTNLLNPKVGAFYISFLPQFVPAGADVAATTMLLAAVHALLGLLWFVLLIAATRPVAALLRRPRVIRTLDSLTGAVFLLFGLRLAFGRD